MSGRGRIVQLGDDDWQAAFSDVLPGIDLSSHLHQKQAIVRADPAWVRAVLGTRRSGKTEGFCCEGLEVAEMFPGCQIPYILPTIGMGQDIVWPKVEELDERFKLGLRYNRAEYKVFTPSGGCLQLFGLSTKPEAEKGRGKKYPLVIFDECGAHNQELLQRSVTQTFGPATADFRGMGGRGVLLGGTAGYEPDCYWEKLIGGNEHRSKLGASVHFMTIWDNPFFAGREQLILDSHLTDNGLLATDAGYIREWRGLFCTDTEGLCYSRWNGAMLPRHSIPTGGYTVLGLDLGHTHPCSWVVVRFVIVEERVGNTMRSIHHGHVLESYQEAGCSLEKIVGITRTLMKQYSIQNMVGDSGGSMAPTVIEDLHEVYGLPIKPVEKAGRKAGRIWMADSQLGNGTLFVHVGCDALQRQLKSVPWNEKRTDHHEKFPDHSLDALHYALTLSRQHLIETELPPLPGTRAWAERQSEIDLEATIRWNEHN